MKRCKQCKVKPEFVMIKGSREGRIWCPKCGKYVSEDIYSISNVGSIERQWKVYGWRMVLHRGPVEDRGELPLLHKL